MLGEKIHQLRKEKGMSQEQLAVHLTVSRQAVSKWELGESVPDVDNIISLSKIFGVSTDYLLIDEPNDDTGRADIEAKKSGIESKRSSKNNIVAYCFIAAGLFGILTFWILSSVIPAEMWVADPTGISAPIRVRGEETDSEWQEFLETMTTQEPMTVYTLIHVRGNLWAFLTTYNFRALFLLCCALVIVGYGMLARWRSRIYNL